MTPERASQAQYRRTRLAEKIQRNQQVAEARQAVANAEATYVWSQTDPECDYDDVRWAYEAQARAQRRLEELTGSFNL